MFNKLFERSYSLVRFWTRWQFAVVIFSFLMVPVLTNWPQGLVIFMAVALVFIYIFAFIGVAKSLPLKRIYWKGYSLIKHHKNKELVKYVGRVSKFLSIIIVLDLLLPLTWVFSLPFKLLIERYLYYIKFSLGAIDIEYD
ncbi:hypothetical protein A6V39_04400 [Candidatus Mycoplasma haematobovis]|uniref:Uncharacterized protein n=1 Tax=Candidatus Mycoplasma haematobovis TaxID=432608 RepID=A0A1A9QDV4_9MOLU|nr:hypothetical protein [Candidatus Mycoplasma haematobovis]OAL10125.1 hypothetical protein A6V39_04400 [Candidatus Mycoplasma haematobovis]